MVIFCNKRKPQPINHWLNELSKQKICTPFYIKVLLRVQALHKEVLQKAPPPV